MVLGRTLLWRNCTCSVRRAVVLTTGFLRSTSPVVDLIWDSTFVNLFVWKYSSWPAGWPCFSSSLDTPEEDSGPGSTAPGPAPSAEGKRGAPGPWTVDSRTCPCQDDSHSFCEWGQAWNESGTRRPSFFVWMRFGEEGEASSASWGVLRKKNLSEQMPQTWRTRSRRRSGAEEEVVFWKETFLNDVLLGWATEPTVAHQR